MKINYQYKIPGTLDITGSSAVMDRIGYLYTCIKTEDSLFTSDNLHWEILDKTEKNLLMKGINSDRLFEQNWKITRVEENRLEIEIDISLNKLIKVDFAYTGLAFNPIYWHYSTSFSAGIFPALDDKGTQSFWPEYPEKEGIQISSGIKGSPLILFSGVKTFNYSSFKLAANSINKNNEARYYRIDNHFGTIQLHPGKYMLFNGTIDLSPDKGWMAEDDSFLSGLKSPKIIVLINPLGQGFSQYFSAFLREHYKNCEVINLFQNLGEPVKGDINIAYPVLSGIPIKERIIHLNHIRKNIIKNNPDTTILFCNNLKRKKDKYTWILGSLLSSKTGYLLDLDKKSKPLYSLPILILSFISKKLFYISWDIVHPLIRFLLIPLELLVLIIAFIWLFFIETYYSLRGIRHKTS